MSNVLALDPSVELEWTPKCDKSLPEKERLVIVYRQLTMREAAEFSDEQIQSASKGKKTNYKYLISAADIKRISTAIKGWKNFNYPTDHPAHGGDPVPFTAENITLLPPAVREEFIDHLTGRDKEEEELGEAQTE